MSNDAQALGLRLKAERERRGMSTQKVADEMHLDAWVIDALEAGDYRRIGAPVYAKGHLKKYASLLGLPASEIAAGYDAKAAALATAPPLPTTVRHPTPPDATLPWLQVAGVAAIVVVVGGVAWWRPWHVRSAVAPAATPAASQARVPPARRGSEPRAEAESAPAEEAAGAASAPRIAPSAPAPSLAPAPPVAATAGDIPSAPSAAASAKATGEGASPAAAPSAAPAKTPSEADLTPGVGRAQLRLSFSADSWVDVHDYTGRRVFSGNGRANSVKTIEGIAPLRVYLGFASGVQLEVNDRAVAIGREFVSGDVARFEAGADGVLRRDSHLLSTSGVQTRAAHPND
ncbi:MAG TPA: helix-turn-helix domain-containing protein [Steroidobacteraceae bacterium]|nr:helix-turn-helix domain-containing protein [Steroidobacteraceae bacterium]